MAIGLVRTAWAGTSGGPGITQLYVRNASTFGGLTQAEAQAAVNAVRAFWNTASTFLPDNIVLTVSPVVDQYDIPSGRLEGTITAATPPGSVTGASTAVFSMAAGMKVNLNTATIRNGRRIRGGIFIVPAASTCFDTNGAVLGTTRTTMNNNGANLLTALGTAGLQLVVFSRPNDGEDGRPVRTGDAAPVTSMETNEKTAILRGRRD